MLQSLTDCLDIVTEQQPQRQTERCADHADKRAVHKENPHNHPFGCPHRAQNRHIAPFVFHQHNQRRNNVKSRHIQKKHMQNHLRVRMRNKLNKQNKQCRNYGNPNIHDDARG